MEECVTFDENSRVAVPDFCAAFAVWYVEHKGEDRRIPSNEAIGKAIAALSDSRIAINPTELRDNRRRYYAGIALNERGIELWKRALQSKIFEGKTISTTSATGSVNDSIPTSWLTKPSIVAMRASVTACNTSCHPSVTDPATVTPEGVTGDRSEGDHGAAVTDHLSPPQTSMPLRDPLF